MLDAKLDLQVDLKNLHNLVIYSNKLMIKYRLIRNLQKKVCQDEPRIEWNFMSRNIMYDVGIETMQKRIVKYIFLIIFYVKILKLHNEYQNKFYIQRYKYWPFQFMMAKKSTDKNNIKPKEEGLAKCQFYQCYVDLSELLFPGSKCK